MLTLPLQTSSKFPPVRFQRRVKVQSGQSVPQIRDQTVEVARIVPQERIKPAGESASVRERVRQFEMNGGVSRTSMVEPPRVGPDGRQSEDPEDEAPNKRRKQESDPDSRTPVHLSLRRLEHISPNLFLRASSSSTVHVSRGIRARELNVVRNP